MQDQETVQATQDAPESTNEPKRRTSTMAAKAHARKTALVELNKKIDAAIDKHSATSLIERKKVEKEWDAKKKNALKAFDDEAEKEREVLLSYIMSDTGGGQ